MQEPSLILYYFHDPMCSWCWGFKTCFKQLCEHLPGEIKVKKVLGGLAPDSAESMPEELKEHIKSNWSKIETMIPGVKFNFDFWKECQPRRSTYAACRAVIAARHQGEEYGELMIAAIQNAYYQQARNPSDEQTLIELARELLLDEQIFVNDLKSEAIENELAREINFTREMYVESFPSLIFAAGKSSSVVKIDYNDHQVMLNQIKEIMDALH